MFSIHVEKTKDELIIISWQFSKIHIPLCEITEVTEDNPYAGVEEKSIIQLEQHMVQLTQCFLIKTVKQNYLLFTTNRVTILNKIKA